MSGEGAPATPWADAVNKARASGYSWDDIHSYQDQVTQKALGAGYSQADINSYFGQADPAPADQRLTDNAKAGLATFQPKAAGNWWEDFKAGVERSSGGLLLHGEPTLAVDPKNSGFFGRLLGQTGEVIGDIPAMTAGGIGGGVAGVAGGAAVPGAGETGASEVVGGVAGTGAGALALPQFIKSEYAQGLEKGEYKGPMDFAERQGRVLLDTLKAGGIGAVTGLAGKAVGVAADSFGASALTTHAAQYGSQVAAVTGAQAALAKKLPTAEDVADNAILMGAFKGVEVTAPKLISPIKSNLIRNWRDSGQAPADAVRQANNDPVFRQNIQSPQPPDPPPGSSTTPTHSGDFVIPRIKGAFDDAADWVMKHEGGLTTDTGGVTKYGISQNAHPDVDVKGITPDQAREIYHAQYWKAVGADNLPEAMRLPAFDAAINQGVAKAKTWLSEAGGDVQKFLDLRAQDYARLAENPKYAEYAKGWLSRLKDLGFNGTLKEAAEGAGKPPVPPAEGGTTPPPESDPWKIVGSHIAQAEKGPSWGDRFKDEAYKAYTDLFNPLHPINKLTRAVTDGSPVPDAENPEFLHRLAEHHNELAMYSIERNMIDLDGKVTGPGLNKIIEPFGNGEDLQRFWAYSAAKWSVEKEAQGKATGIEQSPAQQVIQEGDAKYGAAFNQLVEWQNQSLKWMKDAGIHSDESYQKWVTENKARIPGYRVMEDAAGQPGGAKGKTAFNPVKEFKGSDRPIKNIYQSLMRDAFLRMELAMNNRANQATADLGEKVGLAEMRERKAVPVKISADELAKLGVDPEGMDATIFRLARQEVRPGEVPVFRDGKMESWAFDDPNIARVIKGMNGQERTLFQKMAMPFTKFMRGSIVLNPLFPVRLMTYDVPWQFITKPGMRNTMADVYVGLRNVLGKTDAYDQWMRSGGAERIFDGLSKDQYLRKMLADHGDPAYTDGVWNSVKNNTARVMGYAKAWGNGLSQAERVGRYVRGAPGESDTRRAIASADAAFHRASFGGPLTKTINSIQPFTAAYLNSLEQTFRAFTGHALTGEKVFDAKTVGLNVAKAVGILTIPGLVQWARDRDKEWYKAAPDWQKDNGIFLNVGKDDDRGAMPIFIKAPPLLSFFFIGVPRRIMEAFLEDNPHASDHVGEGLASSLLPPGGLLTYNVVTPLIEHMANYSFFRGHALVDEDTKNNLLPQYQANAYSTPFAKSLSKYVNDLPLLRGANLSPPVIDNYINEWGGTLGAGAAKLVEMDAKAPAKHLYDYPLLSSWISRYPSSSAQPISDFEDRMEKLSQIHGSIAAAFKAHDLADFQKLAGQYPVAANMHMFRMRNDVPPDNVGEYQQALQATRAHIDPTVMRQLAMADKSITNLKTFARMVGTVDADKMSATDKQQVLDRTYAMMQAIAERAGGFLDQMGAQ